MPETGSAQGALPLRSAYPARDLTHSKGRRAISPDKTTGSFRRRFVPEPGVLNGKGKTRPFACARSSFLAVRARKAPSPRRTRDFFMRSLQARTGLSQLHPASSGVRAPFIFSGSGPGELRITPFLPFSAVAILWGKKMRNVLMLFCCLGLLCSPAALSAGSSAAAGRLPDSRKMRPHGTGP